jgi:5-carboxyvanillate decarboxylase
VQIYDDTKKAVSLVQDMNDRLAEIVHLEPVASEVSAACSSGPEKVSGRSEEDYGGHSDWRGVLIASHTHGRYLDHPELEPILAALEEEDATLYLHPRRPSPQMLGPFLDYGMVAAVWGFQAEAGTHAIRLIMSGVLDRHPNLKIVLGHLGEALPFWLWRLDNIHQRTYQLAGDALGMVKLKLKPTEYIRRNFAISTSGMFDSRVLRYCIDLVDHSDGAPAKNHTAISESKIIQPQDEVGMKGQIGLPHKWCAKSQAACITHASPMKRYDRSPA